MNNPLRICANNLVEGGVLVTAISATTAAGTLPATNLLNSIKSSPWRSTAIAAEQKIRVDFAANQVVNMIALCTTNLSAGATIKAYLYTNIADVSPVYTSPVTSIFNNAVAGQAVAPLQNGFSYGNSAQGVIYFPSRTIRRIDIGITNTANPDGYIQVGNLVVGSYWAPLLSFERGENLQIVDESRHTRTDGGDLLTDIGAKYRKVNFKLSNMQAADRAILTNLLRANGVRTPIFISMFPADVDPILEDLYSLQGKLESLSPIEHPIAARYAIPITIQEL